MISAQMIKLTAGGSAIRALFEEGAKMAAEFGRENVYDFSIGNPNFPAPQKVNDTICQVVQTESPTFLHGYMPNAGYPDVRQTVADSLNRRFGTLFAAGDILMTVGAAGGLNVILKTLLNPGDRVVVFAPFFLEYGNYIRSYGGVVDIVEPDLTNFQINLQKLEEIITPETKAVILNNPNNPTGVVYGAETVKQLAAVLEKKQKEFHTSIYLISDEPYRELAYDGVEVPFPSCYYRNTVIGYSWSKSLSLPGERIGYLAFTLGMDEHDLVRDAAVIANRILGFVNAPSLMQRVIKHCIDIPADIGPYDKNRKALYDGLTGFGFQCVFPQGAFYMWMKTPVDDQIFVQEAKRYHILVVPGASFACPGYVRIAYCVDYDMIVRSMDGFRKLAKEFGLLK